MTMLTAHITCGLMSNLVMCKHRKKYDHTWHPMSLLEPSITKQKKTPNSCTFHDLHTAHLFPNSNMRCTLSQDQWIVSITHVMTFVKFEMYLNDLRGSYYTIWKMLVSVSKLLINNINDNHKTLKKYMNRIRQHNRTIQNTTHLYEWAPLSWFIGLVIYRLSALIHRTVSCRFHFHYFYKLYSFTLCKKASNHHANLPLEMYSFTL